MHAAGGDDRPIWLRQVIGKQQERACLRSTEAAVKGDELLECAAFLEILVVETPDHDVGNVPEAIRSQKVAGGIR